MLAGASIYRSCTVYCCSIATSRVSQSSNSIITRRRTRTCSTSHSRDPLPAVACRETHSEPLFAALSLYIAAVAGPAEAAELSYNNASGNELIRNVAGTIYVVLLAFFAGRLFIKRANRNRSQVRVPLVPTGSDKQPTSKDIDGTWSSLPTHIWESASPCSFSANPA